MCSSGLPRQRSVVVYVAKLTRLSPNPNPNPSLILILPPISFTLDTFQLLSGWLKDHASAT